ncbi:class I SAM-dependent methyltransferase [Parasphingopyxis algicola]|uniref:class I SAM-dependent methyltransferase n=1 Tax=Parasphingopyxis algicola TaxID=2026624 RepID=UPI00159F7DC1|nr:methyltransferase domain-containing protein [Parasphingopyxis algicola]QLC26658.1 class I SAM-dependent methyltransferase [Parasphingopyxis algicola]
MTGNIEREKCEHRAAALRRHRNFADDLRNEPLAFWDLRKIETIECVCCDAQPSHVSAYPFASSERFARQIIVWCENCGFGMVPQTSFPLEDYYREEYALQNRGDRHADPELYFAKMDSEHPPKNLARYIARARYQIKNIRRFIPRIGAMLDVGAGPGYALRASGADKKFALEHDEYSRKFLHHIGATLVEWETASRHRYDVILLSHSLEHFEYSDVVKRLRMLVSSLNPGGLLYVEVPPGGLGWKHYSYKHEPHTLFFTPEALRRLATKLGGEVLKCEPTIRNYNLVSDLESPIYHGAKARRLNDPRGRLTLILRNQG